jgi:hypothetical protein
MKKVDLNDAAEEFETISSDTRLFYNKSTGEFDYYCCFYGAEDEDTEKFEDDDWIAVPRQQDLNEYNIMVDFTETVTNPRKNELLSVALEGKGAFRRFKDTLYRVDLEDEWYAFKRKAFVEIAREWCEENSLRYIGDTEYKEAAQDESSEDDIDILDTLAKIADMMEINPEVTVEQIAVAVGVTEHEIESYISDLKTMRIVKQSNTRKGSRWVVNRLKKAIGNKSSP